MMMTSYRLSAMCAPSGGRPLRRRPQRRRCSRRDECVERERAGSVRAEPDEQRDVSELREPDQAAEAVDLCPECGADCDAHRYDERHDGEARGEAGEQETA